MGRTATTSFLLTLLLFLTQGGFLLADVSNNAPVVGSSSNPYAMLDNIESIVTSIREERVRITPAPGGRGNRAGNRVQHLTLSIDDEEIFRVRVDDDSEEVFDVEQGRITKVRRRSGASNMRVFKVAGLQEDNGYNEEVDPKWEAMLDELLNEGNIQDQPDQSLLKNEDEVLTDVLDEKSAPPLVGSVHEGEVAHFADLAENADSGEGANEEGQMDSPKTPISPSDSSDYICESPSPSSTPNTANIHLPFLQLVALSIQPKMEKDIVGIQITKEEELELSRQPEAEVIVTLLRESDPNDASSIDNSPTMPSTPTTPTMATMPTTPNSQRSVSSYPNGIPSTPFSPNSFPAGGEYASEPDEYLQEHGTLVGFQEQPPLPEHTYYPRLTEMGKYHYHNVMRADAEEREQMLPELIRLHSVDSSDIRDGDQIESDPIDPREENDQCQPRTPPPTLPSEMETPQRVTPNQSTSSSSTATIPVEIIPTPPAPEMPVNMVVSVVNVEPMPLDVAKIIKTATRLIKRHNGPGLDAAQNRFLFMLSERLTNHLSKDLGTHPKGCVCRHHLTSLLMKPATRPHMIIGVSPMERSRPRIIPVPVRPIPKPVIVARIPPVTPILPPIESNWAPVWRALSPFLGYFTLGFILVICVSLVVFSTNLTLVGSVAGVAKRTPNRGSIVPISV